MAHFDQAAVRSTSLDPVPGHRRVRIGDRAVLLHDADAIPAVVEDEAGP